MSGPDRQVDLDAFAANVRTVRQTVAPAQVMLVVKNDAYRHGVGAVVPRALEEGVRWFGAFDVQTGEYVLEAARSVDVRIFVWTVGDASDAFRAVRGRMDVGIGDLAQLDLVASASQDARQAARVHLKIDTGLHRNGFRPEEWADAVAAARAWEARGAIRVEGVWSHIAEASDADDDAARALFDEAIAVARTGGLRPSLRHLAASAASFARPEFRYDMVRVGAFAYGIRPAGGPGEEELGISPVLSVRARVLAVEKDEAILDIGSLDGLPSPLAGVADVDAPSGPVRILSIDPFETRVRGWPGAAPGDHVTVYGPAPARRSATDLAELIDTIGEEIVLRTGKADGTLR
jgi:alanine racemase